MDIGNPQAVGPSPQSIKTEYSPSPSAKEERPEKVQESFGSTLNRMSGISEEKDLYKDTKNSLSKDSYLKMMMEQLKYQDPFNPVKNEQFTQNMAMMSQLEQQINMNKSLEKMITQNNNMQIAALQLVGKTILADHAALHHETGKFSTIQFKLPQDAKDVAVDVTDSQGQVLKTINVGARNEGDVMTKWDGTLQDGSPAPSGKYTYKIKAAALDGKEIQIASKIEGRVTGVTNAMGVTFLLVGDQKVALNEVEMIKESASPAAPTQNSTIPVAAPSPASSKSQNEVKEDEKSSGTKLASSKVEVDPVVEKALRGEDLDPIEKESLNDLMQVMFR